MPIVTVVHQILRSSGKCVFSSTGNVVLRPRTEVVVHIIIRIVTVFRIIFTIFVHILERSQEIGISGITVGGPVSDAGRHHIARGVIAGNMLVNLSTGDLEMLVEFDTHVLSRTCTDKFQRTGPVVVTFLSETDSSQFQLTVGVMSTNPQCGAEHGRFARALRNLIFGDFLEPHCTTSFNIGAYIVHRQLIGATCRKTGSRFRFRCGRSSLSF